MSWKGHGKTFQFHVYEIYEIPPEDEENVVHVGDLEVLIQIDMEESLSGWLNCTLKVLKADGTEEVWDAAINGMNLEYTTDAVTSDFNRGGEYKVTPYGEAP